MNKRKMFRIAGAMLTASLLAGTTALAAAPTHDWKFGLSPSEGAYTELVKKETTTGTAYVTRKEPDTPITTVEVTVFNSGSSIKSATKSIKGVGTVYLSYSGYNVNEGDYLRLYGRNPSADNQGKTISASGTWRP